MSDITQRMAKLSSDKRRLLLKQLAQQQIKSDVVTSFLPVIDAHPEQLYLPFPLTDIQQTYWIGHGGYFDLSAIGTNVYMEFELIGDTALLKERLNLVWNILIERHAVLRMFVLSDGQQQFRERTPFYTIPVVALDHLSEQEQEHLSTETRELLSLKKGPIDCWPLFDLMLHQLTPQRLRLYMRIDALLIDGTSRLRLLEEFFQLLIDPRKSLPPLPFSFRDYVLALQTLQESNFYQNARQYWWSRISSLPPSINLPIQQQATPTTLSRFVYRTVTLLNSQQLIKLKSIITSFGTTPSIAVITAFAEVLGGYSKQSRFLFGLIGSDRLPLHPQIQTVIGNFNTIYLLEVDKDIGTFQTRLGSVQKQIVTGLEYRIFSGIRVLRELNRRRGCSAHAALPVLFNSIIEYSHTHYQYREKAESLIQAAKPIFAFEERGSRFCVPQISLLVVVSEGPDGSLVCTSQDVENLFARGLVDALLQSYARFMQALVTDMDIWNGKKVEPIFSTENVSLSLTGLTKGGDTPAFASELTKVVPAQEEHSIRRIDDRMEEELTEQIMYMWQDLLGRPIPNRMENFFELGGDSFLVVRLLQEIDRVYQKRLALQTFIQEGATIACLVKMLR